MYIYRLLIMFAHRMGWALVWVIGGPGPRPRPLVLTVGDLLDIREALILLSILRWSG